MIKRRIKVIEVIGLEYKSKLSPPQHKSKALFSNRDLLFILCFTMVMAYLTLGVIFN